MDHTASKSNAPRCGAVRDRYSIYLEEQGVVAFLATDIEGFFSDTEPEDGHSRFVLIAARTEGSSGEQFIDSTRARKEMGNIDLNLLNERGETIGTYYIAAPKITDVERRTEDTGIPGYNITLEGFTMDRHRKFEESLWETRRSGGPHVMGTWKKLPPKELVGWLDVCRIAGSKRSNAGPTESTVVLDGLDIRTKAEFYCAVGEAINGPGGYFGSNLDSLRDCLVGGHGLTLPVTIVWTDSELSRLHLGDQYFGYIIEALDRQGVTLSLI